MSIAIEPAPTRSNLPTPRGAQATIPEVKTASTRTPPSSISHRQHAMLWHPMLTEIAQSPQRKIAAESIVTMLAKLLTDHTVRFGWGSVVAGETPDRYVRLYRLLDSKLGWLGAENSVYQSLKAQFEKIEPSPSFCSKSCVRWESANLILDLRCSQTTAAVIWIRPPQGREAELQAFSQMVTVDTLSTLAAVFFSRPVSGRLAYFIAMAGRGWSARTTIGLVVLLIIAIACIPVTYRVDAVASVTAMNARRVAAPLAAMLAIAHVRPGDYVTAGQALLELDGRPLRIELEALTSEIDAATKDEDISLASGQIAQAQLATLRRRSLSRRRELIVNQLDQLVVTSPIDGIVIQGDLQHSLGAPLELGQTLLEIAPSDSVEIELEIPEVEIGYIDNNTPVQLWFPAIGSRTWETQITTVWPAATIRDDENVFIAKTPMPRDDAGASADTPRVGMRGEAMALGPKRPWIWKWVRLPIRRLGWLIGW